MSMLVKLATLLLGAALRDCEGSCHSDGACAATPEVSSEVCHEVSLMQVQLHSALRMQPVPPSPPQDTAPLRPPDPPGMNCSQGSRSLPDISPNPFAICTNSSNDGRFLCPQPARPIPPVIFVKTLKTGSETLVNIIDRLADRRNKRVMASPKNTLGFPCPFPGNTEIVGPPEHQYDILAAHVIYDESLMRKYVRPSPFFLTILREPGSQHLSAYNYFAEGYQTRTWEEHIAWVQTAQPVFSLSESIFINSQATQLGWYDHVAHTRAHDTNPTRVQAWLESLESNFIQSGLVILMEYFDEGMVLLRRRLQLDMHEMAFILQNSGKYFIDPTEEMREQARNATPVDVQLYAHFNRTFQQAWAAAYGPELEAELAELRRLNQELEDMCGSAAGCPYEFTFASSVYIATFLRKNQLRCQEIL